MNHEISDIIEYDKKLKQLAAKVALLQTHAEKYKSLKAFRISKADFYYIVSKLQDYKEGHTLKCGNFEVMREF